MSYQDTLPAGHVIGGEYSILKVLGTGGFATTYLARDLSLQRDVAIKEYFPRDYATRMRDTTVAVRSSHLVKDYLWGLRRFAQEAQIISKFRHPSVVRVYRILEANNTGYIVLEYVDGADMEVWLGRRQKAPGQNEFDKLAAQVIEALGVVHSAGVLHRDIKPANIYIRSADLIPVLLDFGSSKFEFGDKSKTTNAIVSRGYSPQEAYASDTSLQGPWTDIYGFAATLYFAIAGIAPPEAPQRALRDDLVPAARLPVAGFRPGFLAAIDWGLRIQPDQRPQYVDQWLPVLLQDSPSSLPSRAVSFAIPTIWSSKPRRTIWSRLNPVGLRRNGIAPKNAAGNSGRLSGPDRQAFSNLQPPLTAQPSLVAAKRDDATGRKMRTDAIAAAAGGSPAILRPGCASSERREQLQIVPPSLGRSAAPPLSRRLRSGRGIGAGAAFAAAAIAIYHWNEQLSDGVVTIWAAISPPTVQVDRGRRGGSSASSEDWFSNWGYGAPNPPSAERGFGSRGTNLVPTNRDSGASATSRARSASSRSPANEDSGGRAGPPSRSSSPTARSSEATSVFVPQ